MKGHGSFLFCSPSQTENSRMSQCILGPHETATISAHTAVILLFKMAKKEDTMTLTGKGKHITKLKIDFSLTCLWLENVCIHF